METSVLEKEQKIETTDNIQEDSIEYKSGGFNMWGVNVENDNKSSRHSAFFDESVLDSNDKSSLTPAEAGEIAATTTASETPVVKEDSSFEENSQVNDQKQVDNFAYYVAKQMIEEGTLPPYEDVDEDITFEDIYDNFKITAEEKLKSQVLSEVQTTLQSAGVTDENIVLLQAIQNGVPIDELNEVNKYQKYSNFDDDIDADLKLDVIKEWYKSRNLSDREIKRNLEAIEISDEIDSEFADARVFFKQTIEEYHKAQREIALRELEQRQAIQLKNQEVLNRALTQGVIANEKLTLDQSRQLQKDIYERSRGYNVDGQQVYLSPFEEFLYLINNDFEFQLYNYKNYKFRNSEVEILKEQAKEQADKDYLEAFKKAQGKSAMKGSIKKRTETTQDGFNVYRNETGGRTFEF